MASQTSQLALGALAAAAVGVGVVVFVETQTNADVSQEAAIVVPADNPAAPTVTAVAAEPAATPALVDAPEQLETPEQIAAPEADAAATPESDPAVLAKPAAPVFDTFRVEGDGLFVIAGKAIAGQTVDVMLAGEAVERLQADANGSFGAVLVLDPSDQPRRLGLLADPEGDAVASAESYLVEPFAVIPPVADVQTTPTVVGAVTEENINEVLATVDVTLPEAPEVADETDVAETSFDRATVLVADNDGVRVVPTENDLPPEVTANIALDTITYDPEGDVEIAGRASGDGFVQVYIDNQPVTTSRIVEGGNWSTDLPEVDTGIYTLRIDEVDTAGEVVSRIETPFKREEAETVAAVLAEDVAEEGFDVAVRTVQPGSTLWAIAKEELGAGVLYVAVYEANKDLIRDPDLIYPGQVFRLPDENAATE